MYRQARKNTLQTILQYWQNDPVFLDTETTGLEGNAEIIEICLLDHEGNVMLDTLVKPCLRIPWQVTQVHGITNEMVASSPGWDEIWPEVLNGITGRAVGVYNSDFDVRMLAQTNRMNGISWNPNDHHFFCIMKLYAELSGSRWQKLEAAGRQCGLSLPNAHRAQADTRLAMQVFAYLVRQAGLTGPVLR
jgi:DNA polymerase III subunit epsilon